MIGRILGIIGHSPDPFPMAGDNGLIIEIKHRARNMARESLVSLTGNTKLFNRELSDVGAQPDRLAFLAIADWALKITFRVAFKFESIATLARQDITQPETLRKSSIDLAKEFCNLTGGALIQLIESPDRPMGLSIPIDARISKSLIYLPDQTPHSFHDTWCLTDGNASLQCQVSLDVTDAKAFSGVILKDGRAANSESEFTFL